MLLPPSTMFENGKQSSPSKKGKSEKEAKASKAGKTSERTPKASKAGFVQPQSSTSDPKSSPSEVDVLTQNKSQNNETSAVSWMSPQMLLETMACCFF